MNYVIRRAQDKDLDSLVSFTVARAREAEGAELDPSSAQRGVEADLSDQESDECFIVLLCSRGFQTA